MAKSKILILFDIDDVLFKTEHFIQSELTEFKLYEDVLTTLDKVAEIAEIGILSQGELSLQTKKLIETGIHNRFAKDKIHIVEKKDETLTDTLKKYIGDDPIFFIDDRLTGLYFAKKALPNLRTVWIKRGRHATGQQPIDGFTPEYTITEFGEILKIIKQADN